MSSASEVCHRVAQLPIQFNKKNCPFNFIEAYLPTSNHTDKKVDLVLEDIDNLYNSNKAHYNIIIGDCKAKIRSSWAQETCRGLFRYGARNERGDTLSTSVKDNA